MTTNDLLAYYATHGALTDPGERRACLEHLPTDVAGLCRVVQGVLIHDYYGRHLYGPPPARYGPFPRETLPVSERLGAILAGNGRPISEARQPFERSVGTCRDFALLLCSFLRNQSVPARVRCGFAAYFTRGFYEDHWVCEYWKADEQRWAQADCQLDHAHRTALFIGFDITDVPAVQFVSPWRAWQMCESAVVDPASFGHGADAGRWFVQVNLVRDLLALRKREVSPWDWWRHAPKEGRVVDEAIVHHCIRAVRAVDAAHGQSLSDLCSDEDEALLARPPWAA